MNIQKMLKQAQEMQAKLGRAQAELEAQSFEGQAAGGAVKVTLSGKGLASKVAIDASLMDDRETLEDMLLVAINDAVAKKDEASASAMGQATAGLPLPAGMKLPFQC